MSPSQYSNYQADKFDFRRKAQKVFVSQGDVILRLHETDIVRVKANGDVVLSTGGWATHKTMTSMNDALELFGMWVDSAAGADIPRGRWQVTDSDGTVHPYDNDKHDYITTIKAKGADDRQRAQWLAEAYEVTYTPAAAAAQTSTRVATGPRVVSAQPAAAAPAGARSNGVPAAASVARPPGIGGSWANVAKAANPLYQATTGSTSNAAAASAGRVTGPGAASGTHTTGPGAAAAPSAAHRTTGPPGFSGSSSTAYSSGSTSAAAAAAAAGSRPQQLAVPPSAAAGGGAGPTAASPAAGTAAVMSAPPAPGANSDVLAHLTALGLQDADDDLHMCVVCMEEPRSIVLVPCGHMALCKDCCQQIMANQPASCPMCCQQIEYHVEVDS